MCGSVEWEPGFLCMCLREVLCVSVIALRGPLGSFPWGSDPWYRPPVSAPSPCDAALAVPWPHRSDGVCRGAPRSGAGRCPWLPASEPGALAYRQEWSPHRTWPSWLDLSLWHPKPENTLLFLIHPALRDALWQRERLGTNDFENCYFPSDCDCG